MIPEPLANGLLTEADYAEKTGHNGGMVLLTPEFTRHIVRLLTLPNAEIERAVADFSSDWNSGMIDSSADFVRSVIFWVIEDRFTETAAKPESINQ